MIKTKIKPVSIAQILKLEFLEPLKITQEQLADAMGVPQKLVDELLCGEKSITIQTASLLSRALGNSTEFWLNTQNRWDIWHFENSNDYEQIIANVKPINLP